MINQSFTPLRIIPKPGFIKSCFAHIDAFNRIFMIYLLKTQFGDPTFFLVNWKTKFSWNKE